MKFKRFRIKFSNIFFLNRPDKKYKVRWMRSAVYLDSYLTIKINFFRSTIVCTYSRLLKSKNKIRILGWDKGHKRGTSHLSYFTIWESNKNILQQIIYLRVVVNPRPPSSSSSTVMMTLSPSAWISSPKIEINVKVA